MKRKRIEIFTTKTPMWWMLIIFMNQTFE